MWKAKSLTMISRPQRRMMFLTAAAAFGSSATTCHAFVPLSRPASLFHNPATTVMPRADMLTVAAPGQPMSTRLYSSSNKRKGLFGGLKNVAKSVLPKRFTQSKEERTAALAKKEQKDAMKSGIKAMLKDAPLAVRMVGSLVAPLLSNLASTVQAQQQQTQILMDDARDLIMSDSAATAALGEPIVVQPPFSQSSSSVSVNGKMSSRLQCQFHVLGTKEQGVASMVASEGGIQSLQLQVRSGTMNISLVKSAGSSTSSSSSSNVFSGSASSSFKPSSKPSSKSTIGKNRINKEDIIDVEFVDKTERRP